MPSIQKLLHSGPSSRGRGGIHGKHAVIRREAKAIKKLFMVQKTDKVDGTYVRLHHKDEYHEEVMKAWDDITGTELDYKEVRKARMLEIAYAHQKKVWTKIPRSEAHRRGWKIVKTRWIDINKGDANNRKYRSRLVAREINTQANPEMFAATPPIEALKLLIAIASTEGAHGRRRRLMVNDVSRAYFYAKATRKVYLEIFDEDREPGDENMAGELQYNMYGTRDAAQNWQEEFSDMLKRIGFSAGRSSPCVF